MFAVCQFILHRATWIRRIAPKTQETSSPKETAAMELSENLSWVNENITCDASHHKDYYNVL